MKYDESFWKQYGTLTGADLADVMGIGQRQAQRHKASAKRQYPHIDFDPDSSFSADKATHRLVTDKKVLEEKYRAAVRESSAIDEILLAIRTHSKALPPVAVKPPKIVKKTSTQTAGLLISDWHIGERVSAEEMGGLSEYDFDIMAARLQTLVDKTIDILLNHHTGCEFDGLEILMLGDMISGIIHEELVRSANETVMEWLIDGSWVFAQAITELASRFPRVHITAVIGNHGRLEKKVAFKGRYVNWDYVFYYQLKAHLSNQANVTIDIPKSFWTIREIRGFNFLALHGDNINSWQGIPFYGIKRTINNLKLLLYGEGTRIDYTCLGHFHNSGVLDEMSGGETILNGSSVGGNEFSLGKLFTSNKPKQSLFGVHEGIGKTFQYNLNLSEYPERTRYSYMTMEQGDA